MSPALPTDGNPVISVFSWTPGAGDVGPHSVAFDIIDLCGFQEHCSYIIDVTDPTAPVARCQDVTVSAGPTCTAPASIDFGSSDPDGDPITLSQDPPGPYALGSTPVTLTVSDGLAESKCQANVTVVDGTPPVIGTCPASQNVNATSPAGAVATFATPGATDNCSVGSITCVPASGSTFPIGVNTVICTATDGSGNTASCQFTVSVQAPVTSAADQILSLRAKVNNLPGIKSATKNSLVVKLNAALAALSVNDTATACARMQDFINLTKAQTSKKLIPASTAVDLIADATRIRLALGCP
jgi:hypothetical protein